jgi:hypothetical protein
MCFVWFPEQTAIYLHRIRRFVLILDADSVFCKLETDVSYTSLILTQLSKNIPINIYLNTGILQDIFNFCARIFRSQCLKVSVFPLSWDFCIYSHLSHITPSEYKLSILLFIVHEWCFANGFSQNMLWAHNFQQTACLLMRCSSQRKVLWTFIIPVSGSDESPHTTVAARHQHQFT